MNVYRVDYYASNSPANYTAFIGAATIPDAITVLGDKVTVTTIEMLGGLMFAAGGEETAKALGGGRQVTLDEAKASITDSHLVSFEDGRPYKSLSRHLKAHGLTFDQYKAKWGLPEQYPSVHPSYTIMRRDMALAAGLGKGRKKK